MEGSSGIDQGIDIDVKDVAVAEPISTEPIHAPRRSIVDEKIDQLNTILMQQEAEWGQNQNGNSHQISRSDVYREIKGKKNTDENALDEQVLKHIMGVYDLDSDDAVFRAHALFSLSHDTVSPEEFEGARKDEAGIVRTLDHFIDALQIKDIDKQYIYMMLVYSLNPNMYLATMERITYDVYPEISHARLAGKINKIYQTIENAYSERSNGAADEIQKIEDALALQETFERLRIVLESSIVNKLPDTHATIYLDLLKILDSGALMGSFDQLKMGDKSRQKTGDDLKLAGSLGVYTYMGSFLDDKFSDMCIQINPSWLDSQDRAYYLPEDYPLKPPISSKNGYASNRNSFAVKLNSAMKREHSKQYLAAKMAGFIIERAIAANIPISDLTRLNLGYGNVLAYLSEYSTKNNMPDNLLGGRPEGHIPGVIPLSECSITVPNITFHELLPKILPRLDRAMSEMQKVGRKNTPEHQQLFDEKKRLMMLDKRYGNLSVREVLQMEIDTRIDATPDGPRRDMLLQLRSSISEYDASVPFPERSKKYAEVLGYQFTHGVEAKMYGNINFIPIGDRVRVYIHELDPQFSTRLQHVLNRNGGDNALATDTYIEIAGSEEEVQNIVYQNLETFIADSRMVH